MGAQNLLSVRRTIRQETQQPAIPTGANQAVSALMMKIANWDGKPQDIYEALTTAFETRDYLDCIKDLKARNIDPLLYINSLDRVSSHSIPKRHAWFVMILQ